MGGVPGIGRLACTLSGAPSLLRLAEPTVGVDPLSRREWWEIIHSLIEKQQLTVLLSTSYGWFGTAPIEPQYRKRTADGCGEQRAKDSPATCG